jgi:hypothetical protein
MRGAGIKILAAEEWRGFSSRFYMIIFALVPFS